MLLERCGCESSHNMWTHKLTLDNLCANRVHSEGWCHDRGSDLTAIIGHMCVTRHGVGSPDADSRAHIAQCPLRIWQNLATCCHAMHQTQVHASLTPRVQALLTPIRRPPHSHVASHIGAPLVSSRRYSLAARPRRRINMLIRSHGSCMSCLNTGMRSRPLDKCYCCAGSPYAKHRSGE